MGDIPCAKCGEKWDAYGIRNGDMTSVEGRAFLSGNGCPCCKGRKEVENIKDVELNEKFLIGLLENME